MARWGGKAITLERLDLIGDLLIHESGLSLRSNFLDMELAQFLLTLLTQAPADAQARGVVTRRWLVRALGPAPSGHPAWPYTGRGFALALLRSLNIRASPPSAWPGP